MRRQRPHLVEEHGGAHIAVNLGQCHEQLSPLVVAEVVQINEPALQDRVWVVSRQNEELGNALIGALLQGLDHKVVLGQGRRDAAGDKLGLDLGKPAANLGLPKLGELDSDGVGVVDLVSDRTQGVAALFPRMLGKGRPAPQPALILWLGVSMAKTWLRVVIVGGSLL